MLVSMRLVGARQGDMMSKHSDDKSAQKLSFRFSVAALATGVVASYTLGGARIASAEPGQTIDAASDSQTQPALQGMEARDLVAAEKKLAEAESAKNKVKGSLDAASKAESEAEAKKNDAEKQATDSLETEKKRAAEDVSAAGRIAADAQKAKTDADDDAAQTQTKLDQAAADKKAADAALAAAPAPDTDALAKAKAEVKKAEDALSVAEAEKKTADDAVTAAEKALETANSNKATADSDLTNAKSAQTAAKQAVTKAEQAVADAQAKVDELIAGSAAQSAKKELEQAKADLETAKSAKAAADKAAASAEGAVKTAEDAVKAAEGEVKKAQEAKKAADNDVTKAEETLKNANGDVASAKQALKDAEDAKKAADQAVTESETALKQAQDAVPAAETAKKNANNAVTAAEQDKTAKEAALAAEKKNLETAKANVEASKAEAQKQWNKGSVGFFEQNGSAEALAVFTTEKTTRDNTSYLDPTRNAGADDSRTLERMKKSIENIELVNAKRQSDGGIDGRQLSVLKINDFAMAVAQANANWSARKIGHATAYNPPYENLYWGPSDSARDALSGWWDAEKRDFDRLRAQGMTTREQMDAELRPQSKSVGHYTNLVDDLMWGHGYGNADSKVVGYAVRPGLYGYVQSLGLSPRDTGTAYSIAEYKQLFMTYYNGLKDAIANGSAEARTALADAEKRVADAQSALNAANDALAKAKNDAAAAATKLTNAKTAVTDAEKVKETALADQTAKGKAVVDAQAEVNAKAQAVAAAQSELAKAKSVQAAEAQAVAEAEGVLTAKRAALTASEQTLEAKKQEAKAAADAVTAAEGVVARKQAAYDAAMATDALAKAKDELDTAEKTLETKKSEKNDADKAVAAAEAKVTAAEKALADAKAAKGTAEANQATKVQAVTEAQKALADAQRTLEPLATKQAAHEKAQENASKAARALQEAEAADEKADKAADDAAAALDKANSVLSAKRALAEKLNAVDTQVALRDGLPAEDDDFKALGLTEKFAAAIAARQTLAVKSEAKQAAEEAAKTANGVYSEALASRDAKRAAWLKVAYLKTDTASEWLGLDMMLSGYGFLPNETVKLELHSNVFNLGTAAADATGSIKQQIFIPAHATVGAHTIIATGQTSGLQLTAAVDLLKKEVVVDASQEKKPSEPSMRTLPDTGSDAGAEGLLMGAPLALIGAGALARRKARAK